MPAVVVPGAQMVKELMRSPTPAAAVEVGPEATVPSVPVPSRFVLAVEI
jgi:hypothetical protein